MAGSGRARPGLVRQGEARQGKARRGEARQGMVHLMAILVLVVVSGCALPRAKVRIFPACPDGLPVEILTDPACPPDSVCGYSCLPDRWEGRVIP